jgi:hypothetical protein
MSSVAVATPGSTGTPCSPADLDHVVVEPGETRNRAPASIAAVASDAASVTVPAPTSAVGTSLTAAARPSSAPSSAA